MTQEKGVGEYCDIINVTYIYECTHLRNRQYYPKQLILHVCSAEYYYPGSLYKAPYQENNVRGPPGSD